MKRGILFIIALVYLTPILNVYGQGFLNSPSGLNTKVRNHPIIVTKPNGGFVELWEEQDIIGEMRTDVRSHFYQILDTKGHIIEPRKELDFWKSEGLPLYEYNENSLMFLDSNLLLIIARKMVNLTGTYNLEKLVIDLSRGTFLRDSIDIGFQNCSLVRNSLGDVYAIELGFSPMHYLRIIQVEPSFGRPRELIKRYPQKKQMKHYLSSEDNAVTMTSKNNLLVVGRVLSVYGKPINESPDGWNGLPNRLACFLADTIGNAIIESFEIDLTEVAFQKISGIHVGGIYRLKPWQATRCGLDFTRLSNGDIVLSVTGLDKKAKFCMYQVRFNSEGELQKPAHLKEVNPNSFPKDHTLVPTKIKSLVIYLDDLPNRNKILTRREYVLFGFDDIGNYYEDREIWKEGEE